MLVTLTNKTNRHVEIEGRDGVSTIINSGATSEPLEESNFDNRTKRLIKQGQLFQRTVETIKEESPETVSEAPETEEPGTAETPAGNTKTSLKRATPKK